MSCTYLAHHELESVIVIVIIIITIIDHRGLANTLAYKLASVKHRFHLKNGFSIAGCNTAIGRAGRKGVWLWVAETVQQC